VGRGVGAAALVCLISWVLPAWAGVADQVGATFGLMIQDFVGAFPAVEGLVVAVDGERLYMDLVQKDGVQPGQEFTIFRKGGVFRHPISSQPMGRFEDVLGHAQVTRVEPRFSEAVYVRLPGTPDAQPEDGVRITRGRIRVAVAPPTDLTNNKADLRRVAFMIAHALSETKRFQSVDPSTVQDLSLQRRGAKSCSCADKAVARPRRSRSVSGSFPSCSSGGVTYLDMMDLRDHGDGALLPAAGAYSGGDGGGAAVSVGARPRGLGPANLLCWRAS
jgi:hypothetical protein